MTEIYSFRFKSGGVYLDLLIFPVVISGERSWETWLKFGKAMIKTRCGYHKSMGEPEIKQLFFRQLESGMFEKDIENLLYMEQMLRHEPIEIYNPGQDDGKDEGPQFGGF